MEVGNMEFQLISNNISETFEGLLTAKQNFQGP